MSAQPLLALADRITKAQGNYIAIHHAAADELRRLVDVNAELLKALENVVERFGPAQSQMIFSKRLAIDLARAAITKAKPSKAEGGAA